MDAHTRLFDRIAPGYRLFYGYQRRMFKSVIAENAHKVGAEYGDSFLDIGCGTGALVSVLSEAGYNAEGVDAAPHMVAVARSALLKCELADIDIGLRHPDKSFDFVISSFVAHGLRAPLRAKLYREGRRLARKAVVIHDYHGRQPLTTELIERLEGGDYFRFIESGVNEMAEAFDHFEIIEIAPSSAWYVGRSG